LPESWSYTRKGLYEIHITVGLSNGKSMSQFETEAHTLGCKSIVIQLPEGQHQTQVQSGFTLYGPYSLAFATMKKQVDHFRRAGFPILRAKIEVKLGTCNGLPQSIKEAMLFPHNYFEFHLKVVLFRSELSRLSIIAKQYGAHLSRNALTQDKESGAITHFLTLRFYAIGEADACARFHILHEALKAQKFTVAKTETEYAVFDSNVQLDAGWIDTPSPSSSPFLRALHLLSGTRSLSLLFDSIRHSARRNVEYLSEKLLVLPLFFFYLRQRFFSRTSLSSLKTKGDYFCFLLFFCLVSLILLVFLIHFVPLCLTKAADGSDSVPSMSNAEKQGGFGIEAVSTLGSPVVHVIVRSAVGNGATFCSKNTLDNLFYFVSCFDTKVQ